MCNEIDTDDQLLQFDPLPKLEEVYDPLRQALVQEHLPWYNTQSVYNYHDAVFRRVHRANNFWNKRRILTQTLIFILLTMFFTTPLLIFGLLASARPIMATFTFVLLFVLLGISLYLDTKIRMPYTKPVQESFQLDTCYTGYVPEELRDILARLRGRGAQMWLQVLVVRHPTERDTYVTCALEAGNSYNSYDKEGRLRHADPCFIYYWNPNQQQ